MRSNLESEAKEPEETGVWVEYGVPNKKRDDVIPYFGRVERRKKDGFAWCGWFGFPEMEQIYTLHDDVEKVIVDNICLKVFLDRSCLG